MEYKEGKTKVYKSHANKFRVVAEKTEFKKVKITGSNAAARYIRQFYVEDESLEVYESFYILLLNRANNTIGFSKLSSGGISSTVVDMTLLAKIAINSLASGIIIAHNHPSGKLEPSSQDLKLTRKIKEICELFDMSLLDSLILTDDGYYSSADEGLI